MNGRAANEIERPRSAVHLIGATFNLYVRFPFLFLILAAGVVVPYELIVLWVTGAGPLAQGHVGAGTSLIITTLDSFLIGPLISALHVHAVRDVRDGARPRIVEVSRRSLLALPVVSAVTIISLLGIAAGFVALIVPGVLLWMRWSVVAQTAALDGGSWTDALRRSDDLTTHHYRHIFGLLLLSSLISVVPSLLLGSAFGHSTTTAASFTADTALQVLLRSFTALATALLFFDLKARAEALAGRPVNAPSPATSLSGRDVPPTGHPLDPTSWRDEDRPPGWYLDPAMPTRMRYWAADGTATWSKGTAKTPKDTLVEWENRGATAAGAPGHEERSALDLLPPPVPKVPPKGHPLDPASWSDEDRPAGWYVDPDSPWRMRYWAADGESGWSKRTTKTPKDTLANWEDRRWTRGDEPTDPP